MEQADPYSCFPALTARIQAVGVFFRGITLGGCGVQMRYTRHDFQDKLARFEKTRIRTIIHFSRNGCKL